jgi:hypothetical protein
VGAAVQRGLLEDEGVEFKGAGGIALARFGWLPRERGRARPARKAQPARKAR